MYNKQTYNQSMPPLINFHAICEYFSIFLQNRPLFSYSLLLLTDAQLCLEPQKWIPLTLLVQLQSFPSAGLATLLYLQQAHTKMQTRSALPAWVSFYKSKEKEQQQHHAPSLINWFLIWEHFTAPAEELSMVNSPCLTAGHRFSITVSLSFPYYIQQHRICFQPEKSTWNCQSTGDTHSTELPTKLAPFYKIGE